MRTHSINIATTMLMMNLMAMPMMAMNHVGRITKKAGCRYVKKGAQKFLTHPYLEIPGQEFPCQKKAIVNAWIYDQVRNNKASEDTMEMASMISLIQPCGRLSSVSEKCVKKNMLDLCGESISNREADAILKELKPAIGQFFCTKWEEIAKNHGEHTTVCKSKDVDVIFDFLKQQNLPIMAAIYIGSPTLDEVMQHRFQYVYRLHFDETLGRYYAPAGFDERDRAKGVAPIEHEPAFIFHMGIPNQFYNQLSTKRFLKSYPERKICGDTALAKLNLPNIDPKDLMAYSLSLLDCKDKSDTEPGLERGSFRYPLSLYHFSFAPSWPKGGQETYLGQPLWPQNFLERKMALHRENYAGEYSPLALYVILPNPLDYSGFEVRLKKKGFETVLRLYATVSSDFAMDAEGKLGDFDHGRTSLSVFTQNGREREKITLDQTTAKHYFSLITSALKVHVERNFCFKTRYLIKSAGITEQSFSETGFLSPDNAYTYYLNSLRE